MSAKNTERNVIRRIIRRAILERGWTVRIAGTFYNDIEKAVTEVMGYDEIHAHFFGGGEFKGTIFFVINGGTGEAADEVVCDHHDNEAINSLVNK